MAQLQILGFQKMCGLSSHLGGVFGVSIIFGQQFNVIFDNFVPLSRRKLGRLTFLQWTHQYKLNNDLFGRFDGRDFTDHSGLSHSGNRIVFLFFPKKVRQFTGLELPGGRGVTEVRAILGGFFVALGAAPLIFGSQDMYLMLGIAYLVAIVRFVSMFIDHSLEKSNYISLVTEIFFGIILIL